MNPHEEKEKIVNYVVTVVGTGVCGWSFIAWLRILGIDAPLPVFGTISKDATLSVSIPVLFCLLIVIYLFTLWHNSDLIVTKTWEKIPPIFNFSLKGELAYLRAAIVIFFYVFPTITLVSFYYFYKTSMSHTQFVIYATMTTLIIVAIVVFLSVLATASYGRKKSLPPSLTGGDDSVFKSVHLDVGGRHGSGWETDERLTIGVRNSWFEIVQVTSIQGRWRTIDNLNLEMDMQEDSVQKYTLPSLVAPEKRLTYDFVLTAKDIDRSGIRKEGYSLDTAKDNQKSAYFVYGFRVEFKTDKGAPIHKVVSFKFLENKYVESGIHSMQNSAEDESMINEFHRTRREAEELKKESAAEAARKYKEALLYVQGFWDENTESWKNISRVRLWMALVDDIYNWNLVRLSVGKPQNINEAESIFKSEEDFMQATRRISPQKNSEYDFSSMLFCAAKARTVSGDQIKQSWADKVRIHGINAKANLPQGILNSVRAAYYEAVIEQLMNDPKLENSEQ